MKSVEEWSGKDRGDENFPVGSWLIRRDLRAHLHAFYNFARNADDIADSPLLAADDKIYRLNVMEDVLLGRYEDGSPSALGLRTSLAVTGVVARHACNLLVAFRQDAVKTRYTSWEDLEEYCRYSAMPVGRHVLDLHGEGTETHAPSDALCASLQVLNHLQDGARDLSELDRSYLPQDLLSRAGAVVEDVARPRATTELRAVFDDMLIRVEVWNAAAASLPGCVRDRRLRLETAVITGLARRLTQRLRSEDPVAGRVKLAKFDGVASLISAMRFLP
ncbi:MAG: squalene synthase HpnC [Acetobacteraceae bacterium]|nr:squalene synthase HpnC [Acetobacteraceae bacterium]MSP29365.1 squalene synthase HpnC [Acetobacteraceae bacterium]